MSLILAVETSSAEYGVALCTPAELVAERTVRRDQTFSGIGQLVAELLHATGTGFADLTHLAVDVGPGNLSSVRTGVAYVNGLAFSLGREIFCANSFELLAGDVAGAVLCLRKAGGGNAYAGLFRDGATLGLRHGPLVEVVTGLCRDLPEVQDPPELSVAGAFRAEVAGILPRLRLKDTGVEAPHVRSLQRLLATTPDWSGGVVPVASPLTETSEVFGG